MSIRRLILDVLIPHQPDVLEYARQLGDIEGIDAVSLSVIEQDDQTRTLEIVFEGANIQFDAVKGTIEQLGGSVHSIDHVAAGRRLIDSGDPIVEP